MADRTVIIFGSYGGIGSALARRLVGQDDRLVLSGRDPERLETLVAELPPGRAEASQADATSFADVDRVVDEAVERHGSVDAVVSCVGSVLLKPAHLTRPEEWQEALHTNLSSSFAILRASARHMRDSGGGTVVFVSTAAASIGLPNHEAIAAAKGGIDALVRSAAATYGSAGIRVNAVAPGLVDTPLTARITGNENARAASVAMHALRRIGTPDEVAASIAWLLSAEASWVTGQTLGVDGGLGAVRSA